MPGISEVVLFVAVIWFAFCMMHSLWRIGPAGVGPAAKRCSGARQKKAAQSDSKSKTGFRQRAGKSAVRTGMALRLGRGEVKQEGASH
jgi:hypothetical protein